MTQQPVVLLGVVSIVGILGLILMNGNDPPQVAGPSPEVLSPAVYVPPKSVQVAQSTQEATEPSRMPQKVAEPARVPQPIQEDDEAMMKLPGSSGRPVETETEQDIRMSLPRRRLANGICPGEKFRRTIPGSEHMGGLPLSDCEPYPGLAMPQGGPSSGDDGASAKSDGHNCDTQFSKCRGLCIVASDSTRNQLCRADCELIRARCIQAL